MRIFNKIIYSNKEPSNYNDIWFDGTAFRIYKEGEWQAVTSYNGEGGADITIDSKLSDTSENPVQNKAIKAYVDEKVSDIGQNENTVVFYVNSHVDTPLTEEQLAHNIKMFNRVRISALTPMASFFCKYIANREKN